VGTLALILATYTPLFEILGLPFYPVLKILQIPEAALASQTLAAGFADMLLPSILATPIQSDLTRFVIAAVSVTQLIYLSEVGSLLLSSKIPVNFKDLVLIFVERTIVTLPIIAIIAHFLF
ncbi:MAG: YjiH family protein, partial [Culicoidibacterales bacterium]